jgi:hypothetical protein
MRSFFAFLLPLALIPLNLMAEEPNPPVIPSGKPMYSASPSISGGDKLSEHCKELSLQVQQLKGQPQRRWAVNERYKAECVQPQ